MNIYVIILLAVILCIAVYKFFTRKRAIVNDIYEYLDLLDPDEWKSHRLIKEEMEKVKGGWLSGPEVSMSLSKLKEEDLVEDRVSLGEFAPINEYRKKGEKIWPDDPPRGPRRRSRGFLKPKFA